MSTEALIIPYCQSCGRRARCRCYVDPQSTPVPSGDRYDSLFRHHAGKHGLNWRLIKAQAVAESSLNPRAQSRVGAMGLMQFMPATWAEWGKGDPLNPEASIDAACRYMVHLYGCYGEIPDEVERYKFALAAYNAGRGNVNQMLTLARGCPCSEWDAIGRPPGEWQQWAVASRHLADVTGPDNAAETIGYVNKIMGGS